MFWFLLACNDFQVIDETEYVEPEFDIFEVQAPPPGVDIVAVVDGSGSMSDNWSALYYALPSLMNGISNLGSPWRFTAISADPDRVAPQPWIDPSTTNLEWATIGQFQHVQGLAGQAETGLDASFALALNFPEQLVEENDLYFIFISDEDDQSSLSPIMWKDLFSRYKLTAASKVYSGFIGETGGGCGDNLGENYLLVANATVDLCEIDYSPIMAPLNARITPILDRFILEKMPAEDSISVYINGFPTDQWTYTREQNDVYISAPIPVNSTIVVTYYLEVE